MNEISNILGVTGLFLLRVGIPIIVLVVLGILIDRWQTKREERILAQYQTQVKDKIIEINNEATNEDDAEVLKRAS